MNYDDIQFGDYDPEHDFSQDITGKFYQPPSNDHPVLRNHFPNSFFGTTEIYSCGEVAIFIK